MRKVPFGESLRVIVQGSKNWVAERPIVVSFEVTNSCTCHCRHCDHGGPKDMSKDMKPASYREYMKVLQPVVVQVSGGEPLLRSDLEEVVRNIKSPSGLPYIILVSNWSSMTIERYQKLREAGVDEFCVSLDFPDAERHDDFRGLPGHFEYMEKVIPAAAALGYDDIVMNNCITAWNIEEINANASKAEEWGVNINFSAYSPRRIGCRDYFPETPEKLAALDRELEKLKKRMNSSHWITTNNTTLDATREYFHRGGTPNCKAGLRWLVVTNDGALQPCSMQFKRYGLHEQKKMIREFTENNTCDECYVSIRSYLDKSYTQLLSENVAEFFSFKTKNSEAA
ncbi:MAG: radical SAM protein [Acidobacteria bacterium]|nr:radical SAM protein [Acidobacteriota bacterium]